MKFNPDDFDYDRQELIECPFSDYTEKGYRIVEAVPHKREGWLLCEVADDCNCHERCEWAGHDVPTILEAAVARGLTLLDAEAANKKVYELTLENIALRAELDLARRKIELWDSEIKP